MLNRDSAVRWLQVTFAPLAGVIDRLCLFGSVARSVARPNDCDVLILTSTGPDDSGRAQLRQGVRQAEADFEREFGVPLSICLLGVSEFQGLNWFKENGRMESLLDIPLGPLGD